MYKVVILGAGNIAAKFDSPDKKEVLTHAHAFANNAAFQLLGFYDKDYGRAEEAAQTWGGQAYDNLEVALEGAEVVSCCVPDSFHGDMLKKIARYNPRLVIAEKPLAISLEEAEEIKQIYENRIPLLVNYSRRFLPEFRELKEKIKDYGKFLRGVGYYGKGILHNGSHMIDLLRFLLGEVEDIMVLPYENHDFGEVDSSKEVILKIQQGLFHMIAVDCRIATIFELELFFEKVRIRILDGGNKIETYVIEGSKVYAGYKNYQLSEVKEVNYSGAMEGLARNAENFLNQEEKLLCSLADGMNVLRTCMRIRGEKT